MMKLIHILNILVQSAGVALALTTKSPLFFIWCCLWVMWSIYNISKEEE